MANGANVGNAYITIIPSMRGAQKTIAQELGAAGSAGSGVFGKGFLGGVGKLGLGVALGNVLSQGFNAFAGALDAGIRRMDILNNYPKVMESLGYSAESAASSIDQIKSRLDGLPSSTQDIASFVQQLTATMGTLDGATSVGLAFNDMMLAGGQGAGQVANAMQAYNNILAKGKVEQDNWNTLVQTAPGQLQQLSETLLGAGKNQADLKAALNDGTVTLDEFNDAIVELDEKGGEGFASFQEQARAATGGVGTALDNVKNRMAAAWANILDSIGQENISGVINDISSNFGRMGSEVGAAIKPATDAFFGFYNAIKNANGIDGVLNEITGAFIDTGTESGAALASLTNSVATLAAGITSTLSPVFAAIMSNVPAIAGVLDGVLGGAISLVTNLINQMAPVIGGILTKAGEVLSNVLGPMMGPLGDLAQAILPAISAALSVISGLMSVWGAAIQAVWTVLMPVYTLIGNVAGILIQGLAGALEVVTPLVSGLGDGFRAVGDIFADIVNRLSQGVATLVGNMTRGFESVRNAIRQKLQDAANFAQSIPGKISGFFSGLGGKIANAIGSIKNAVEGKFNDVVNFVKTIPQRIVEWFSGLGGRIASAIGSIHFPTPHVTWETIKVAGADTPFSLPHVSWYAKGGIFSAPSVIGVGEAGPEAVAPISKLQDMIYSGDKAADDQLIEWLAYNLGPIIAEYAPTLTRRDFDRYARGAVKTYETT